MIVAVVVSSPLGTRAENDQPQGTQASAALETAAAAPSEEIHEVDDEAALVRLANGSTWAVLGSTKYELPSAQLVAALGYSFEDAFLATPADLASLRESGERVQVVCSVLLSSPKLTCRANTSHFFHVCIIRTPLLCTTTHSSHRLWLWVMHRAWPCHTTFMLVALRRSLHGCGSGKRHTQTVTMHLRAFFTPSTTRWQRCTWQCASH